VNQNVLAISLRLEHYCSDPSLSSTSERVKNNQINPGNPDGCWTVINFENTLSKDQIKSTHHRSDMPFQPFVIVESISFATPTVFLKI